MKKTFTIFLSVVIMCLSGCSVKNPETKAPENGTSKQAEESDITKENTKKSREISFNGDIVISPGLILILTDDGHVWGKGYNVNGNLGNGKRIDSSEWTQIPSLENIVGIYASIGYGDSKRGSEQDHCYALDKDGCLYRWGGNIFTPETVNLFSNIKSVNRAMGGKSRMTVECENGEKYFMVDGTYSGSDDVFIPYISESEIDVFTQDFILSSGKLRYFPLNAQVVHKQSTLSISEKSMQDFYEEDPEHLFNVDNIEVKSADGYFFVDKVNGELYQYNREEKTIENLGGKGMKKCRLRTSSEGSDFTLFENGTLSTSGDNTYGQLGDGTTEDLDNASYKIVEASFKDFVTTGFFVAALDYDNNLWAWGEGYEATPKIVVTKEDFQTLNTTD